MQPCSQPPNEARASHTVLRDGSQRHAIGGAIRLPLARIVDTSCYTGPAKSAYLAATQPGELESPPILRHFLERADRHVLLLGARAQDTRAVVQRDGRASWRAGRSARPSSSSTDSTRASRMRQGARRRSTTTSTSTACRCSTAGPRRATPTIIRTTPTTRINALLISRRFSRALPRTAASIPSRWSRTAWAIAR